MTTWLLNKANDGNPIRVLPVLHMQRNVAAQHFEKHFKPSAPKVGISRKAHPQIPQNKHAKNSKSQILLEERKNTKGKLRQGEIGRGALHASLRPFWGVGNLATSLRAFTEVQFFTGVGLSARII
eukprot:5778398-Amphidinium_carterae.2